MSSYYRQVIDIICDTFSRYKGVKTVRYQSDDLNNAQNNYPGIQVYIDDVTRSDLNIVDNIFKVEINIIILEQPSVDKPILDVQDECYTLAATVLAKLDVLEGYRNILSVYDYSIITVSHVTDDDAAGVRLTIVLSMPSPANLCDDSVWGEPWSGETDYDVDVPYDEPDKLDINPITLPKNPVRC